ncbi:Homeobox protein [Collichthys lucidus]|uniref:Homeobox protein n=1 Tax=Collichthys lucidus TaxID=240159 RepID=A0A4U5VE22_COLLU|nr:Homeobox protein [Collichthys lucidus]
MSLSPKHTTPFSVTDILSPIEETYKKFSGMDGAGNLTSPLGAYRQPQVSQTGMQQHSMGHNATVATTYHMPHTVSQFSHSAMGGYCNGSIGNMGDLPSYQESMRNSAAATGWYSANPDPRYSTNSWDLPQAKDKAAQQLQQQDGNMCQQQAQSPRRVAVPVLVKDGKPCQNGSNTPTPNQQQVQQSQQQSQQQNGAGVVLASPTSSLTQHQSQQQVNALELEEMSPSPPSLHSQLNMAQIDTSAVDYTSNMVSSNLLYGRTW